LLRSQLDYFKKGGELTELTRNGRPNPISDFRLRPRLKIPAKARVPMNPPASSTRATPAYNCPMTDDFAKAATIPCIACTIPLPLEARTDPVDDINQYFASTSKTLFTEHFYLACASRYFVVKNLPAITGAVLPLNPIIRLPPARSARLDRATHTSRYKGLVELFTVMRRVRTTRQTSTPRDTADFTDSKYPVMEMGQSSSLETYWTNTMAEERENAFMNMIIKQIVISLLIVNAWMLFLSCLYALLGRSANAAI
jgi:hypothetical protein